MNWFYNLKIRTKLMISFIVIALIAGAVGIVGIINIKNIQSLDKDMYTRHTSTLPDVTNILGNYQKERMLLRDLIIVKDPTSRQDYINKFKDYDDALSSSMKHFDQGIKDPGVRQNFDNLQKAIDEFKKYRDIQVSLITSGQESKSITSIYTDGARIAAEVQTSIDNLNSLKIKLAEKSAISNEVAANTSTITMITTIILGIILASILGIFISRIISVPLKELEKAADKLAVGDINVDIKSTTTDEIGNLAASFNQMVQTIREQAMAADKISSGDLTVEINVKSENDLLGKKLKQMVETNNEILNNINTAAQQVASGATQVSASSQALSQGATEQASSIEEITSSITQVSAQTKQNADNANQANELSIATKLTADEGNNQMKEMINAMSEINSSSANISKIIKVIDEIAFQTNILALNAAVEAARAGQHGKGFAVVAEEVRNLAARSANAAKETTEMIESSINKVTIGTQLATNTAKALNNIVDSITKAAALVGEIADASNEQASGINQINQAIEQVAQVVQTNSATAEESASASEELSSQAELLKDSVMKFKLKDINHPFGGYGSLTPDVLHMLEKYVDNKKSNSSYSSHSSREMIKSSKPQISLDDNDFGKY